VQSTTSVSPPPVSVIPCLANGFVPIAGGRTGDKQAGLRKRRADRSSDQPGTPPPVGEERSCTVDLQMSMLQSHHRYTGHAALSVRPERVVYKTAVLTFRVLHGIAPNYLQPVVCVADLPGRRALLALTAWVCHRSSSQQSVVGLSRLPVLTFGTVYSHEDITSAPTLSTFRQRLKTYLFTLSFPHLFL